MLRSNPRKNLLSFNFENKVSLNTSYREINREIIELSKAGDRKAQYQLYSLYARALFNICMRMLNNRTEAEDALQDAFSEIFAKLNSFRYESAFGAWTKRIVINTCINRFRKKKVPLVYRDEIHEPYVLEDGDEETGGLSVEDVRRAMESLPDGYRVIFSLYLLEGYDHGEIAQILGISESTSKTQYMKAKHKMKEILKQSK